MYYLVSILCLISGVVCIFFNLYLVLQFVMGHILYFGKELVNNALSICNNTVTYRGAPWIVVRARYNLPTLCYLLAGSERWWRHFSASLFLHVCVAVVVVVAWLGREEENGAVPGAESADQRPALPAQHQPHSQEQLHHHPHGGTTPSVCLSPGTMHLLSDPRSPLTADH